jgi:hypothetical protein
MDRTTPPRLPDFAVTDLIGLFAHFGVGDMAGVGGTEARTVKLSPRSSLSCPLHRFELRPDACRSCRVLVGDPH